MDSFMTTWISGLLCVIAFGWFLHGIYTWGCEEPKDYIVFMAHVGIRWIIFITLIGYLFVVQPSRTPTEPPITEENGFYEQTMEAPSEKSPEELKEEADKNKPDVLRRQDENAGKDIERTNRILENMLKEKK